MRFPDHKCAHFSDIRRDDRKHRLHDRKGPATPTRSRMTCPSWFHKVLLIAFTHCATPAAANNPHVFTWVFKYPEAPIEPELQDTRDRRFIAAPVPHPGTQPYRFWAGMRQSLRRRIGHNPHIHDIAVIASCHLSHNQILGFVFAVTESSRFLLQ